MKKNSNRNHHQNLVQYANYMRMTDRNAQIKHQSKLSRLMQKISLNEHNDTVTSECVETVEENNE